MNEPRDETPGTFPPHPSHNESAAGLSAPPPIPPQTAYPGPLGPPKRGLRGIHIAMIASGAILVVATLAATAYWGLGKAKDVARSVQAQVSLRSLGLCAQMYIEDYGRLPSADTFVTDLADYAGGRELIDDLLTSPFDPDAGRAYSMNALLSHVSIDSVYIQSTTVLFFETQFGSPPGAGPGHLPGKPRSAEGYCVVFLDGHVENVPRARLGTITWGSVRCPSCEHEFGVPSAWRPPQPVSCPACGEQFGGKGKAVPASKPPN